MTQKTPNVLTVPIAYEGQRLDNFLVARFKTVPKTCFYRLIRQGKIRINQKRSKPSTRIQGNDIIRLPKLTVQEELPPPKPSVQLTQTLKEAILFENEAFLIINKPYGLAVHGGSGISLGVIESLRQLFPNLPYLSLVHRLDRETSGCLLISKKPASLRALHALFREQTIKKTYLLLTKGHWPKSLHRINQPLRKNQLQSGERMVYVDASGQVALTDYTVQKYFKTTTLLEATPHTGRTHQIRVHAKYAKHPIVGDDKYGDKVFNQAMKREGISRLFLHAYRLQFTYPPTGESIQVMAPLPDSLQKVLSERLS